MNALGLETFEQVNRMIMVSPPVNFIDFSFLGYNPKIRLVRVGLKAIEGMFPSWNPKAVLRIIQGEDHFYWGKGGELKSIIREFLEHAGT